MTTKLISAFKQWPHGTVAPSRWFQKIGIHRDLLFSYKRTGWIRSLGQGAYARSDDSDLDWTGAVYALQQHYGYNLYPGARSALELRGLAHYVRFGFDTVFLLSPNTHKNFLPLWFKSFENDTLKFHYLQVKIFTEGISDLVDYTPPNSKFVIKISSVEQALLEMLSLVNRTMGLDESFKIFENAGSIDPVKMSYLLRNCTSIKAKRLFMVMAERINHSWVNELDLDNVNFGSGYRSMTTGGILDQTYSITVPKDWYDNEIP